MVAAELKVSDGNMAAAARNLGMTERQIGLRVKRFGIDLKRFRRSDEFAGAKATSAWLSALKLHLCRNFPVLICSDFVCLAFFYAIKY
jgi:hypothetical protein